MYLIWVLLLLLKPGDYISLVLVTITKDDSSFCWPSGKFSGTKPLCLPEEQERQQTPLVTVRP